MRSLLAFWIGGAATKVVVVVLRAVPGRTLTVPAEQRGITVQAERRGITA